MKRYSLATVFIVLLAVFPIVISFWVPELGGTIQPPNFPGTWLIRAIVGPEKLGGTNGSLTLAIGVVAAVVGDWGV